MISAGDPKVALAPHTGMDSCMYDRGEEDGMKDLSVQGLNTYSLWTAEWLQNSRSTTSCGDHFWNWNCNLDSKNDIEEMKSLYESTPDESGSVLFSPDADRISFNRICGDSSFSWTASDGQPFQYKLGSLGGKSISFDDAASGAFGDFLFDNEHERQQSAMFHSVKDLHMNEWNNRLVHYFGAFGDGKDGKYMATAFRDEKVKDYAQKVIAGLTSLKPEERNGTTIDGVIVLLDKFTPGTDRAAVLSALNYIGTQTGQTAFSSTVSEGFDFRIIRDDYAKIEDFVLGELNKKENERARKSVLADLRKGMTQNLTMSDDDAKKDPKKAALHDEAKVLADKIKKDIPELKDVSNEKLFYDKRVTDEKLVAYPEIKSKLMTAYANRIIADRSAGKNPKLINSEGNAKFAKEAADTIDTLKLELGKVNKDDLTRDQKEFLQVMLSWVGDHENIIRLFVVPPPKVQPQPKPPIENPCIKHPELPQCQKAPPPKVTPKINPYD